MCDVFGCGMEPGSGMETLMGEGECMGGAGSEGGRADADEFMEGREIAGDPILVPFPMTFAGALLFFFQLFSHAMSAGCHVLQGLSSWFWVHSFPFFLHVMSVGMRCDGSR